MNQFSFASRFQRRTPSLLFEFVFPSGQVNRIVQQPTGIQIILLTFITAIPRVLANQVYFSPRHFQHIQEPGYSIIAQLVLPCKLDDFEVGEPTIKFAV